MYYLVENKTQTITASLLPHLNGVPVEGQRVVTIDDRAPIDEESPPPLTLNGLLSQKFAGLLALNPQYNHITYDDFASQAVWDPAAPSTMAAIGVGLVWLPPFAGLLQTITIAAAVPFDRGVLTWNAARFTREYEDAVRLHLFYEPVSSDTLTAFISNDGGGSFTPVINGLEFVLPSFGDQIVVRFENTSTQRVYIEPFGVLY
jgi:hypothetical protein